MMLRVPLVTTAVILAVIAVYALAGQLDGDRKLALVPAPPGGRGDYAVTLAFPPERFHQTLLQDRGRVVEVHDRTLFMRDVDAASLRAISREYWVSSVRPWNSP